jgi:hypothetical protein
MIPSDKDSNTGRQVDPQEVLKRVGELRQRAEDARKEMLQGFADDAQEEARVYRQRRDELAKASPDDPRLAILDARILGADRLAQFASGKAGGGTIKPVGRRKPATSEAKAKKRSKPYPGKP